MTTSTERIAVLGDIHANASALKAAVEIVESWRPDETVLLGDLLTYGVDVDEVLGLVAQMTQRSRTVLVRGNHDVLYADLRRGNGAYYAALPGWLREAVDVTLDSLDWGLFESLPFVDEHTKDRILFAHANPFGVGKWDYLNTLVQHSRAADAMAERKLDCGIFGHTHRPRVFEGVGATRLESPRRFSVARAASGAVVNAGSVGQPRDGTGLGQVLLVTVSPSYIEGVFEPLIYDREDHVRRLLSAPLSKATLGKLTSYFKVSR